MSNALQDFKDVLAEELYGMTAGKAQELGICLNCKEEALPKCHTDAGRREYGISGLCEECFDAITLEE